jgi:hypothetical protein
MKMKHLKKFNENKEEALDIEYIRHCFIDFIEDENAVGDIDTMVWDEATRQEAEGGGKTECSFSCYEPVVAMDIEDEGEYFAGIEKVDEFSKNLRSAISRLRDEYPSYKIAFHCELQEGDMKTYQRCIVLDISL